MNVSLFIRVWSKDGTWPHYCLESVRKFASGFSEIVLVSEIDEAHWFLPLEKEYGARIATYKGVHDGNPNSGYIRAQLASLEADKYVSSSSDFVFTIDSDTIFTQPVNPLDYFVNGKPILLIQSYENVSGANVWKKPTENFLKIKTPYETMRRMPAIHHAGIYAETRQRILKSQGLDVRNPEAFVKLASSGKFPKSRWMADFNILGAVVLSTHWRHKYYVVNLDYQDWSVDKIAQFWGHRQPYEKHPDTGKVPLDRIRELGINPPLLK